MTDPRRTLADAVAAARSGQPAEAIADPVSCTLSFIRLCDILRASHLRGVAHAHIDPNCIILGDDGLASIDGWRDGEGIKKLTERFCARSANIRPVPADGLHDDIRNIGACLFFALVGDDPHHAGDGSFGDIPSSAQARIPPPLLQIIQKSMATTAAAGYADIAAMRSDLLRFLQGAVSERRQPSLISRTKRAFIASRRSIFAAGLLLSMAVIAALTWNWWGVRTFATWGMPLETEDFTGSAWKLRWSQRGRWEFAGDRITSASERDCTLVYKPRLIPPVAIEYTGRFASSAKAGDLSVWWCEDDSPTLNPSDNVDKTNSWFVQAGAYENSWCAIWRTPDQIRSQINSLVLQPDRDYRFRVEIGRDVLRMWIDGSLVLEHRELLPIACGNIGLYTWNAGKTFTNVRIWQQEAPALISPLAIGDDAYRNGRFADAVPAYARVAASHRGTPIGEEALFFQGLALHRLGMRRLATKAWLQLPDGLLRHRADTLELDNLIADGDVSGAVGHFTAMWRKRPDVHDILLQRWQVCGQRLCHKAWKSKDLEAWIALRDACFAEDHASRWLVGDMLDRMGRWQEILTRFPDEHRAVAQAMLALGRNAELLAAHWATSSERASAKIGLGDVAGALAMPDLEPGMRASLLCKSGRPEEALAFDLLPAVIYLDRIDELLATVPPGSTRATGSLIAIGRVEEVAALRIGGQPSKNCAWALTLLGRLDEAEKLGSDVRLYRMLEALAAGDMERAKVLRATISRPAVDYRRDWFTHGLGLAMVDEALGSTGTLRDALLRGAGTTGTGGNRQALVCAAALDAQQDQAVTGMPWRTEATAWLHIAQALRAELAGDRVAAQTAWRAFAGLPPIQRLISDHFPSADIEAFARWRMAALAGSGR